MKAKKKSIQTKSINTIKLANIKTVEQQKNTNSTNQKTIATIEQNFRTYENSDIEAQRLSLKARFSFNKKSCVQRMQQNNLSPFSNDGRSFSPKYRKTPQKLLSAREDKEIKFALNLKQFQKKKPKSKPTSARQTRQVNHNVNKKVVTINKTVANNNFLPCQQGKKKVLHKKKPVKQDKKQKQQKARIQFQNQFLNMMNNRIQKQKITEMSQQDLQCSIRRKPKLQIAITNSQASSKQQKYYENNSDKGLIVNTMKLKIMRNINREYPNLDYNQKKVMSSIIIIQRLWRQRKVKQFFQHYLTPRGSFQSSSFRESLQKEVLSNKSTMNILSNHIIAKKPEQSHSCQTVPKKKNVSKNETLSTFQQNNFLIRQPSQQSVKQQKNKMQMLISYHKESKLNNKVNKLLQDSILSFQNENEKIVNETSNQLDRPSMIKFVECYRQVKLNKKVNTSKRNNIFSLKESLSQKCLMQKYYQRIFADKPSKDKPKNYELFSLTSNNSNLGNESLKLNQQSSIELFKQINKHPHYISPQKLLKKEEQNENNSQQMKQLEQEQIWIRNNTTYSQQNDSDQLIIKKDNLINSKVQLLDQQRVIIDKNKQIQNFNKQDNTKKKTQINYLTPENDDFVSRNKINQDLLKNLVQKQQQTNIINQSIKTSINIDEKPQYSLKSIQKVSDSIMTELMDEFFKEYLSFQQKQCLVKKRKHNKQQQKPKKPKLPGIQITQKSITQYLNILIPYILNNDRQQILKSLQLFHPTTYQKCHRVQSSVYQLFQFADQEQDDIYWNIISNQGFFMCLQKFWQQNVKLSKDNEKFTNFLDLTYKVYNRCITDAFSQIFNKVVLQRVSYPWQSLKRGKKSLIFQKQIKAIINQEQIQKIAEQVKQKLLNQSFCYSTTEGRLIQKQRKHKKQQKIKQYQFGQKPQQDELIIEKLSQDEFGKVMKIANEEFLQDEKQLIYCVDERYELNGDLAECIFNELMTELENQISHFNLIRKLQEDEKLYNKSQQEFFLQTNETLQTNYHQ